MRILLIGKDGQLGHDLSLTLAPLGELITVGRDTLDLESSDTVLRQILRDIRPAMMINAAAYTAVDRAESEPAHANTINGFAPKVMAEVAQELGAGIIHISTDYVFDGQKNTPYLESDEPRPMSVYGHSKLLGEKVVQQSCDRHIILRTAWVYGVGGRGNFVKTMLRLGAEREELKVVIDQVGSPTWTADLAQAIAQFVPYLSSDPSIQGIYHYTNSGAISWYDFAVAIFEEAKALGFPLKIQQVTPITSAEYPTPVTRPAYSVLSGEKTAALLGYPAPHWRQSLRQMLAMLATVSQIDTNTTAQDKVLANSRPTPSQQLAWR